MKSSIKLLLALLIITGIFTGCLEKKQEAAPGAVVSHERSTGDFTAVVLNGDAKIVISQEDTTAVRIEADSSVIDKVETKIGNNVLTINLKKGSYSRKSITIFVSIIQIDRLECNGVVELSTKGPIESDSLVCKINGAGKYTLAGKVVKEFVEISGAGEVHGFDLQTPSCLVKIAGSGKVETSVSKELDVTISGVGNVVYIGKPSVINKKISGFGKVVEKKEDTEK